LKLPSKTIVLLTLNIGLMSKKARIDEFDMIPTKDLATKASDVEHSESKYAKNPIKRTDNIGCVDSADITLNGTNIWTKAAAIAPTIR
jgi:hypothetical protein